MDRFEVIAAGFSGDVEVTRRALDDNSESVRASALRALSRAGGLRDEDLRIAIADESREVRRTVAELAAAHPAVDVRALIHDSDVFVAEMAAWAIGERPNANDEEIAALVDACTSHPEQLVREASAAALGAIGDPRGLDAIITACSDKPTVRRRAVLALAPFMEDPRVEPILRNALTDHDWQVRQNAEDLLNPRY